MKLMKRINSHLIGRCFFGCLLIMILSKLTQNKTKQKRIKTCVTRTQCTHQRTLPTGWMIDRNSISPKHHSSSKPNYPLECKPNINDLRQLFDDNSRIDNKKSHRHSAIYADAKHTSLDESIFDYKSSGGGGGGIYHQSQSIVMAAIPSSRHPDFERVKQKFDKPISSHSPSSSSNVRNGKKARNFSSFLKFSNKRGGGDSIQSSNCDTSSQNKIPNNTNLTESIDSVDSTKAIAGDSLSNKKIDAYMHSSINIDGLKVSDDEEVSIA